MHAVVNTSHGDTSVLRVEERPDPVPGDGEVIVDVKAAGLNFADVMARMGLYPDAPEPPMVMGYEVAGEVSAVGEGVGGVAVRRPGHGGHALRGPVRARGRRRGRRGAAARASRLRR